MGLTNLAERHGEVVPSLDRPLWDIFVHTAHSHPQNDAVVSLWQTDLNVAVDEPTGSDFVQGSSAVLRWTYHELLRRSEELAAGLRARGCVAGMPLVVFLGNSAEWALFFWTAARMQMPFVPLDPRALADPSGVSKILGLVRPAVVVVSGAKVAQALTDMDSVRGERIRIQISAPEEVVDGWIHLPAVSLDTGDDIQKTPDASTELADISLVVFTSGTTSAPKGCLHTAANLWSQISDYDPQGAVVDRWLVHTPASHIFAINNALRAWSRGDAVILASEYFDVTATLHALVAEKCTFMSAVPTLVRALLAQPSFSGKDQLNLTYVTMGGTTITHADVMACKTQLGTQTAIQAFGMSEGVPIASWHRKDPMLINGYHPGVGKVLPGANIRICAPGSKTALAVNEVGELHIGGSSVIRGYLGGIASENFYEDSVGHWHMTGDQAIIDQDGVLHILGRYKDIIIRAGENISPVKIENALARIDGVTAQVIGIPDETADEVPVAIVRMPTKPQISKIASDLGSMYTLDGVYTLEELGLQSFPLTRTGKIRKDELRKAVLRSREKSSVKLSVTKTFNRVQKSMSIPPPQSLPTPLTNKRGPEESVDLVAELTSIIVDLVGTDLSPEADLRTLMDSVTLLRYTDRVLRRLGRRLYLQDIIKTPTLAGQAALLESRGKYPQTNSENEASSNGHSAPKELGLLFPVAGNEAGGSMAADMRGVIQDGLASPEVQNAALEALGQLGLGVSDVENIYPVRAGYERLASRQRPQTYRHRTAFSIRGATETKVRQAVEIGLTSRPLLRTILVRGLGSALYHIGIQADSILHHIVESVQVPDDAGLEALTQDDSAAAFDPLLTTQVKIVTVRDSDKVHLLITYSHTVFDVISIEPFHRDLDDLLSAPDPGTVVLAPMTPFKLFTDLYHDYVDSVPARSSVRAVADRLRGISKMQSALWPRQRAPGWMIGSDDIVTTATTTSSSTSSSSSLTKLRNRRAVVREQVWAKSQQPWDEVAAREFRYPRAARVVNLPGLSALRRKEKGVGGVGIIDPQTVAVAALAIWNAQRTRQSYAIFNTVDLGRKWPFVPPWIESVLPPAMSVDGPMAEWVLNMLRVDLQEDFTGFSSSSSSSGSDDSDDTDVDQEGSGYGPETVGQFLQRVRREQEHASEHAHAPWDKVLEALGPDEAAVARDAASRQTFVWDITLQMLHKQGQDDYVSLRPEARYDWADCGLYWNCCTVDQDNMLVIASWDTAQMSDEEVQQYCDEYTNVLRKIANIDNWERGLAAVLS